LLKPKKVRPENPTAPVSGKSKNTGATFRTRASGADKNNNVMFGLLINCLTAFGWRGLIIYLKVRTRMTRSVSLPGIRHPFRLRPQRADGISFREIFLRRLYDLSLPQTIQPKVIIDGGANIGMTSIFFANRYPNARIISVEPDENNFTVLADNVRPYPQITPVKSAIWHKKEQIHVVDKGYGDRGFMIEKNAPGTTVLEAMSLPDLLQAHGITQIDILKLDIEGSEKEVFSQNYESWLPYTRCLIIELHDRMKPGCSQTVFKALLAYDFSLSIQGDNLLFINESPATAPITSAATTTQAPYLIATL
jgi:FkbM family methyltransferase